MTHAHSPLRRIGAAVAVTGLLVGLGACSSGSTSSAGSSTSAEAQTLNVWWYEAPDQPANFGFEAAQEQFKKDHPGVTINFEQKTFDQIQQSGQQVLNSDSAPDVIEYPKGPATLGVAAKAGLLADLSEPAKTSGWDKTLSDATLSIGRVDTTTGLIGQGSLYGVPTSGEYVEVFYNKTMLDAAGVAEPTTFAELENAFATFAGQGVTPLALSGTDYPIVHLLYEISLAKATPEWVSNYQGLKQTIDFANDPVLKYGAETVEDWVKKGYISDTASGESPNDMINAFINQTSPFMISGTWQTATLEKQATAFQWGTFLVPSESGIHEGAPTTLFVVPQGAKNKQLGYDFITAFLGEGPQAAVANNGGVAVAADASQITNKIGATSTQQFADLQTSGAFGFYSDWPVTGYYQQLLAAGQNLIGGQTTAAEYLQAIGDPYNAAVEALQANG